MKLVDTSSWVHQLRRSGNPEVRARVEDLLVRGEAAWCAPVRLELWSGVGRPPEPKVLRHYAEVIPDVPTTPEVWLEAERLAERGRRKGLRAPAMDVLVAACARFHGLALEHDDAHFEWLMGI
jgi:predicted nucleic acid-binding protein